MIIVSLQNENQQQQQTIQNLTSTNSHLMDQLNLTETSVHQLQADNQNLTNQLQMLQNEISKYQNMIWILLFIFRIL